MTTPRRLVGRIALVTGGSNGQGAAHTRRLAQEGAIVYFSDIDTGAGSALETKLRAENLDVHFRKHDVSDFQAWQDILAEIDTDHGRLDILVNTGGSVKARAAISMLRAALDDGRALPGGTVVESSSGNMGVGLAQACRYLGLRFVCVVDTRTSASKLRVMEAYGAQVHVVREPDPETGDLLTARLEAVARIVRDTPGAFWSDQYANVANAAAHATGTMREIDAALEGRLDYLFVATSTGGTLRGCHDYLRTHGRTTTLVAVDAEGSVLFGGVRGRRLLPGFGAGISTPLSEPAVFDRLERVSDLDCVVGCRRLVNGEAVLAGASTGGLVTALERLAPSMAPGSRCAMVCADGGTAYLDTVYDDQWVAEQLGCDADGLARRVART